MANPIKRPNGKWFVQVRHKAQNGRPAINKSATFDRKVDAVAWAANLEAEWQSLKAGLTPKIPVAQMLERYLKEVTPFKGGSKTETYRIKRFLKSSLADVMLSNLSDLHIREWADQRLTEVSQDSVLREWSTLSHILTVATRDWRWLPENFMLRMRKPEKSKPRDRRITEEEIELICLASGYSEDTSPLKQVQRVGAAFCFAIETGMRQSEISKLRRKNIFLEQNYVHLEITKNGESRNVPLTPKAKNILIQVMNTHVHDTAFNVPAASIDAQFRKLKSRTLIENLHFHDTRREALTRLSQIYAPMELAKISGHKDLRILLNTYYSPTATELAEKMYKNEDTD